MSKPIIITTEYFRAYRQKLGFSNQADVKVFFGGKDIAPTVDLAYIKLLNKRLSNIIDKINNIVPLPIQADSIDAFKIKYIDCAFKTLLDNNILIMLNNQGRRPEQVYFSWMRGYVLSNYFLKALGAIFEVDVCSIEIIGDDSLKSVETFKRTAKSDLEILLKNNQKIRIEMQSGFTGINDIKQHKVLEAQKVFRELGVHTIAIHFDLYNGQVAFVKLDEISDESVNWITRQQMEGQTVFNIDQNYFAWKIIEIPPKYLELNLE